jgi:hypothetical protein
LSGRILPVLCISVAVAIAGCDHATPGNWNSPNAEAQSLSVGNASGLTMQVAEEHAGPSLWISIPGEPSGQQAVFVLLPEHVTVRRHGTDQAEHLYLWRPGKAGQRFNWTRIGNALQWETEFASGIHFLARVSLEPDGVLYHYEFINRSDVDFDSVQAVTDPRMVSPLFHDVRLERTYIHTPNGFVLLASEMPERLTMPLDTWLPNRYRASFAWPVPSDRVQRQADGVTFFNASTKADLPVLVTSSVDHRWFMATFSRNPGNLWTNPELTCQHADPEIPLLRKSQGVVEEKMLLFQGVLDDVISKVRQQREGLKLGS